MYVRCCIGIKRPVIETDRLGEMDGILLLLSA